MLTLLSMDALLETALPLTLVNATLLLLGSKEDMISWIENTFFASV